MRTFEKYICFLAALFAFLSVPAVILGASYSESKAKFLMIAKIVNSYRKAGENLSDSNVKKTILKEVGEKYPVNKKMKLDIRDSKKLLKEVRKRVDKKFPESAENIVKKAEAEAEKKFVPAQPMEYVRVRFTKGRKTYTAEGYFYSYGGNSVKIGDRYIAIFDLEPGSRIRFDREFCEAEKKKFINNKLQNYFQEKNRFSTETYKSLREEQVQNNEKAGYVYKWKEWNTPIQIAEKLISFIASKELARTKSAKTAEDKKPEDKTVAETETSVKTNAKPEKAEDSFGELDKKSEKEENYDPHAMTYEAIRKRTEKRLIKIANSCAGIDADQGFKQGDKVALWGMTYEEVEIVLSGAKHEKNNDSASDKKTPGNMEFNSGTICIKQEKGPIAKFELYFYYGLFYKVVVYFRIISNESLQRIASILNERYGLTDEQKAYQKKWGNGEEIEDVDEAEKVEKASEKDKASEKKSEEKFPKKMEYNWSGKITHGKVIIETDAQGVITTFNLIKENPEIVEEAKIIKAKEEQRLLEEERRKKMEEFNKKKIEF